MLNPPFLKGQLLRVVNIQMCVCLMALAIGNCQGFVTVHQEVLDDFSYKARFVRFS